MDSKFIKLAGKINDNRPDVIFKNIKKNYYKKKIKLKKKPLFYWFGYTKKIVMIFEIPQFTKNNK